MSSGKPSIANRIVRSIANRIVRNILRECSRRSASRLFISMFSSGLHQNIGGAFDVRLPPQYCSGKLPRYEPESCAAIRNWVSAHPGGVFIDAGCSKGYIAAGVLFESDAVLVKGIDTDFRSLGICRRVCALAPRANGRLILILAMLAGNERVTATPDEVRENTEKALRRPEADGNPRNFAYVNISSELPHDLPFTSIDQLFIDDTDITLGNCLLKCDVEGAESEVLKGSGKFLRKYRPDIMLSVHPSELVKLGSNKEDVVKLLRDYGYSHDVISVDHEEHWYCKPLKASLEAH